MTNALARLWLWLWRWTVVPADHPLPARCVLIACPHTSNWDFPLTLAMAKVSGIRITWLGKRELFRGPMGPVMRHLGGVSVDRAGPGGLVSALADELGRRDELRLVIPVEGSRSEREYWKSGFYRIAQQAEVPIVCAFVDKSTRSGGFGLTFRPGDDVRADMDAVRAFYAGKTGLRAGRSSVPRLREEDEPPET